VSGSAFAGRVAALEPPSKELEPDHRSKPFRRNERTLREQQDVSVESSYLGVSHLVDTVAHALQVAVRHVAPEVTRSPDTPRRKPREQRVRERVAVDDDAVEPCRVTGEADVADHDDLAVRKGRSR
jgi:hypothetical protein